LRRWTAEGGQSLKTWRITQFARRLELRWRNRFRLDSFLVIARILDESQDAVLNQFADEARFLKGKEA
jgi:hypothetical protein